MQQKRHIEFSFLFNFFFYFRCWRFYARFQLRLKGRWRSTEISPWIWSLSSMSIKINSKCNSILSILTCSTVVITFLLSTSLNETEDAISILLGKSFIVDSGEFLMQVNNSHDRKGTRFLLKSLWWETCWSCLLISFWLDLKKIVEVIVVLEIRASDRAKQQIYIYIPKLNKYSSCPYNSLWC